MNMQSATLKAGLAALALAASPAWANYAKCILDRAPGVANDRVVRKGIVT